MRDILLAELDLSILCDFEEVALNLLPPFDIGDATRFFPVGVERKSVQELLYT